MSDTPRTDKEQYKVWSAANDGMGDEYADIVVDADYARKLERELLEMTESKNKALSVLKEAQRDLDILYAHALNTGIPEAGDPPHRRLARVVAELEEVK